MWKAEWNATVTRNLFIDARVGQFVASRAEPPNGGAPRFEDLVEPEVRGGNRDWQHDFQHDQINGSLVISATAAMAGTTSKQAVRSSGGSRLRAGSEAIPVMYSMSSGAEPPLRSICSRRRLDPEPASGFTRPS